MIIGLETTAPSTDDLKAFSAAFATTSSTPMFHIAGVTPEATHAFEQFNSNGGMQNIKQIGPENLRESWWELNTATGSNVDLVSLGNPHFSLTECATLAFLCNGRKKDPDVDVLVTLGRAVHGAAKAEGYVQRLESFGVQFITDTCWCMIEEPVLPAKAQTLMTNSGKYAHYAPGLVGRKVHFGSLAECVECACTGARLLREPEWLV